MEAIFKKNKYVLVKNKKKSGEILGSQGKIR